MTTPCGTTEHEDNEAGRLVTTMEKDVKLDAAVGEGVVDGPSSCGCQRSRG